MSLCSILVLNGLYGIRLCPFTFGRLFPNCHVFMHGIVESVITNPKNYPKIIAVSPSEGWTNGGQTVTIIGDNFRKGLHVLFGEIPVSCQLISEHAARLSSLFYFCEKLPILCIYLYIY